MSLYNGPMALASVVCMAPLMFGGLARAQNEDLGTVASQAQEAMKAERWEDALKLHADIVTRFGTDRPLQTFGPQFGAVFYHKGVCEMKLKRWDEAMTSFETCYRDFPNSGPAADEGNRFQKMALLKWGEAAMGAEKWELAISRFQKFAKERDRARDVFPQGPFHIGMAVCNYRLGHIPAGNESLEIALKNKAGFPTPDDGIVAGIQALVSTAIASRDEQALLDFIGKNRGELMFEPFSMHRFARAYLKLAGDAAAADMPHSAFALYQFIPSTESAIDDIRARLKSMAGLDSVKDGAERFVRERLEADLAALENERRSGNTAGSLRLAGTAVLHEKLGNIRGAFAAWKQLEAHHPTAESRESNLFNLVKTSALAASGSETRRYAEAFAKDFPNSPRLSAVRRTMIDSLFEEGDFQACIEAAAPVIERMEAGTPEHDLALHALAASYFHTGRHDEAAPLLALHVETYPKSPFALPTAWLRAANTSRRGQWQEAATLLDDFLTRFSATPGNIYQPYALCELAACREALKQPEPAIETLDRVFTGFPDCAVVDQAYHLKGRIELSLGNVAEAEQAWRKAIEKAEARGNRGIAGDSLCSLIRLLASKADPERNKDLLRDADRFWNDYAKDSPFRTQVAIAQVPALESAGRTDDALARLREAIHEVAKQPAAGGLDEAIRAYTAAYQKKHSAGELKDHFRSFPGIAADDRIVIPRLRVAVIEAYEKLAAEAKDEAAKISATSTVRTLYQELKTEFASKDLGNFILVKIGDHLRLGTSTPREALPFYDDVVTREDPAMRFAALLGRADVYSASSTQADLDKALADFTRVSRESPDQAERDYAAGRVAGLQAQQPAGK